MTKHTPDILPVGRVDDGPRDDDPSSGKENSDACAGGGRKRREHELKAVSCGKKDLSQ